MIAEVDEIVNYACWDVNTTPDTVPTPIKQTPPIYPGSAKKEKIAAEITIHFLVTKEGLCEDLVIKQEKYFFTRNSGEEISEATKELFRQSVLTAVAKWVFQPATVNEESVRCLVRIKIPFLLDEEESEQVDLP